MTLKIPLKQKFTILIYDLCLLIPIEESFLSGNLTFNLLIYKLFQFESSKKLRLATSLVVFPLYVKLFVISGVFSDVLWEKTNKRLISEVY